MNNSLWTLVLDKGVDTFYTWIRRLNLGVGGWGNVTAFALTDLCFYGFVDCGPVSRHFHAVWLPVSSLSDWLQLTFNRLHACSSSTDHTQSDIRSRISQKLHFSNPLAYSDFPLKKSVNQTAVWKHATFRSSSLVNIVLFNTRLYLKFILVTFRLPGQSVCKSLLHM